jgi:hypothetical protein
MKTFFRYFILFNVIFFSTEKARSQSSILAEDDLQRKLKFAGNYKRDSSRQVYDSIKNWRWDAAKNSWIALTLETFEYDSNDSISKIFLYRYNDVPANNWITTYIYNSDNDVDTVWLKDATGRIISRRSYEYNSDKTEMAMFYDTPKNGILQKNLKDAIKYDKEGRAFEGILYAWREKDSTWGSMIRYKYNYTTTSKLWYVTQEHWDGKNWGYTERALYTYDINDNNDSVLSQKWNVNPQWRTEYGYKNSYNSKNEWETKINFYKKFAGPWYNSGIQYYTYYEGSYLKTTVGRLLSSTDTDSTYTDSIHYYLRDVTNSINKNELLNKVVVYPNPSSGNFSIKLENGNQIKYLELFNMLGEKILEQKSSDIQIKVAAKGVYFLAVYDEERRYQQMILIQ